MLAASTIKQRALELGFDLVGIAPPAAVKDLEFLPLWLRKGFGGEMRYLANPRREDPRRIIPSLNSVICVGLIYNTPYSYSTDLAHSLDDEAVSASGGGKAPARAWISRYAWGKDYHEVMRDKLEQLRAAVEQLAPDTETRVYVDTGPVVERVFARLSGIGWTGKNTCLINEHKGSWFFLGVILTDLKLDLDLPAPDRCGSCTRCLEACPTGALIEPYVMDASRCISYFNIELRGPIPQEYRTAIGRNVFGCDICQDVCPWNNRPLSGGSGPRAFPGEQDSSFSPEGRTATTHLPEFQPLTMEINTPDAPSEQGTRDASALKQAANTPFSLFNPTLESLAAVTEKDFQRIFAHSPVKRAKYQGWLRNLCVVMGNTGDCRFIPWLERTAGHPDPVVREHAAWALHRLQNSTE